MEEMRLKENQELRDKLDRLLRQARQNEPATSSFDDFALSVMAAQGPQELFSLLLDKQKKYRIDEIRLFIMDRYHEIERLLTENYQNNYPGLSFIDIESCKLLVKNLPDRPILGNHIPDEYEWLIDYKEGNQFKSAALLPLKRGKDLIGIQLLLSRNPNRYKTDDSTTFMRQHAAMTAISIENCINRQRILELGYQDGLTKAYNRRYFDERLKREIDRCIRHNTDLVFLFIDIDHFKKINDNYGHQAGDKVLVKLVKLMRDQVRSSDIVARYGGEEFAIILPDTGLHIANEVAERIRKKVENQKLVFDNKTLKTTVSIGISSLSQLKYQTGTELKNKRGGTQKNLDQMLLKKADEALYQAKQTGRNRVVIKKIGK
jgi:diguanylate cyclase (GGDEF)-like protein